MTPLQRIISDEISAEDGFISVARYMELALYHPEFGYYMTRDPLGAQGDFTTAPEISQMFGEMIAVWIADCWAQMGSPAKFQIIECGAGRGTMMADILRTLSRIEGVLDSAQVRIIECSPILKAIQQKTLSPHEVKWMESIEEISDKIPSIIIGNEFLDALPVRQFIWDAQGWRERGVSSENGEFIFAYLQVEKDDIPSLEGRVKMGVIYESSSAQNEFINLAAQKLKVSSGAILMIDYGYTQEHGGDTLQALRAHEYVSALEHIGQADITTHVNFTELSRVAYSCGLHRHGVRPQGVYLQSLGIESRARVLSAAALRENDKVKAQKLFEGIEAAKRRLTHPDEMGTLFKVFCASYGFDFNPAGF